MNTQFWGDSNIQIEAVPLMYLFSRVEKRKCKEKCKEEKRK